MKLVVLFMPFAVIMVGAAAIPAPTPAPTEGIELKRGGGGGKYWRRSSFFA